MHAVMLSTGARLPAAHCVHVDDPSSEETDPAEQGVHRASPALLLLPEGQLVHSEDPATLVLPAPHAYFGNANQAHKR